MVLGSLALLRVLVEQVRLRLAVLAARGLAGLLTVAQAPLQVVVVVVVVVTTIRTTVVRVLSAESFLRTLFRLIPDQHQVGTLSLELLPENGTLQGLLLDPSISQGLLPENETLRELPLAHTTLPGLLSGNGTLSERLLEGTTSQGQPRENATLLETPRAGTTSPGRRWAPLPVPAPVRPTGPTISPGLPPENATRLERLLAGTISLALHLESGCLRGSRQAAIVSAVPPPEEVVVVLFGIATASVELATGVTGAVQEGRQMARRMLNSGLSARRRTPVTLKSPSESQEVPADLYRIPDLLKWVGSDADRAQEVLAQENDRDNPRKTLIAQLTEIILA